MLARCNNCHLNGGVSGTFNFDGGSSDLINVMSVDVPTMPYVDPGDSQNSYFFHKLNGSQAGGSVGGMGGQMPLTGGAIALGDIDKVAQWIDEGAKL